MSLRHRLVVFLELLKSKYTLIGYYCKILYLRRLIYLRSPRTRCLRAFCFRLPSECFDFLCDPVAEQDQRQHCRESHEGIEQIAKSDSDTKWHDRKNNKCRYEEPCVPTGFAFSKQIGCTAVSIKTIAEHRREREA